jgi:peptidoglycan/LPS O-acetylase OafA/YrhL/protein-tyrosine-phosphatase
MFLYSLGRRAVTWSNRARSENVNLSRRVGVYGGDAVMTESNVTRPSVVERPSVAEPAAAPPAVADGVAKQGSRLGWLDVLRGIAALAVVFDHFDGFLPARIVNGVYRWIDPGNYGVFVFFIISGYIVPASLERKGSVRTFWVSRLFRLYPLYLFAIGFAMLLWAVHFGDLRGEDADPETSVLSQLLMMSNVLGGINLPNVVWSLSYEMIFYLLLTALFMARIHRPSSRYALIFGVAAVAIGGILPRSYLINSLSTPRLIAFAADLIVLAGLAVAVAMRGMSRLVGAILAALVGLTLLAFNGTWLWPWEALSILALMFTGTMLYRAERGDYPWRRAIVIAVAVLGLIIAAGLWHNHSTGAAGVKWDRQWVLTLLLAAASFGAGLAFRHVRWPRFLTWLGLISYSVYLLHPQLITIYYHYHWLRHQWGWRRVAVDASFLVILIALSSLTYLLVERPAQQIGRRLSRWLDARFGPDRPPAPKPVAREPALAGRHRAAAELPGGVRHAGVMAPESSSPSSPLPAPRGPGGPYRVCLVCLGNICRSPMAETVLRAALAEAGLDGAVQVDSAGTGDWHLGEPMHPPARAALARRGYDGSAHRARQVEPSWLAGRDLVLAMDARNLAALRRMAGPAGRDRIRLFGEAGGLPAGTEIPDPYGGDDAGFDHVLDLLSAAAPVLAARLSELLEPGIRA